MICHYCEKDIQEGEAYTYKWFPDDQATSPVHSYHLDAKQTKKLKEAGT